MEEYFVFNQFLNNIISNSKIERLEILEKTLVRWNQNQSWGSLPPSTQQNLRHM